MTEAVITGDATTGGPVGPAGPEEGRIRVKRVHLPAEAGDGTRFLVDRLWPRGVRKDVLHLDAWLREVAPSTALRRWFAHDPAKWEEFQRRYWRELDEHPDAWRPILEAARRGPVTLLYGARDDEHNNAVALKRYLEARRDAEPAAGAG